MPGPCLPGSGTAVTLGRHPPCHQRHPQGHQSPCAPQGFAAVRDCSQSSSSAPAAPGSPQGSREKKRSEERALLWRLGEKGEYPGQGTGAAGTGVTGNCTRSPRNSKLREWDSRNPRAADGLKTGSRSSEKQQFPCLGALGNVEHLCKREGQSEHTCPKPSGMRVMVPESSQPCPGTAQGAVARN